MNILSLFRKRSPEDTYDELSHEIVLSSLLYRSESGAKNDQLSANAGAEAAYFLLHMLDRQAYQILGPTGRDKVIDEVSVRVINSYCISILSQETPQNIIQDLSSHMMKTFNERQGIYSKCSSVTGNPFPSKGTMIFALSFFIHRAIGLTDRDDINDILCGKRDIEDSDINDFPMADQTLKVAIYFGNILASSKINKTLQKLQ